jgi:hypothetical protein
MYICICIYMCVYIYICIHWYVHMYMYIWQRLSDNNWKSLFRWNSIYLQYVHICICIHCTDSHMHICIYVCMYICIYVYMYIQTQCLLSFMRMKLCPLYVLCPIYVRICIHRLSVCYHVVYRLSVLCLVCVWFSMCV